MDDSKPKYFCEICNYGCNHNNVYMKHIKSEKHLRHGVKKVFNCTQCDYKTETSHWNLKMHIMSKHSTIEEKLKEKYYCAICDSIFFSPLFYKNHIKSILHINNSVLNNINNGLPSSLPNIDIESSNDSNANFKAELKAEIKAELRAELRAELKKEIMLEIKKKLLELFV